MTVVKTPFQNNHIALRDFMRSCPELTTGRALTQFACIYYPIAMLELELLENASEEFDTIENAMLELIYAGLKSIEQISEVMGLPLNYTQKLMTILEGYGHIENGELTELGRRSVAEGIKYTKYTTRQLVQADSIHGVLLSREFNQSNHSLFQPDETTGSFQHVLPNPFLSAEAFQRLMSETMNYKRVNKRIFHVNIERIQSIISQSFRFAHAFLVSLEGLPHPIVLLKHVTYSQETRSATHTWRPIALSHSNAKALGAAAAAYEIVEDEAMASLLATKSEIEKQQQVLSQKYNFTAKWTEGLQKQLGLKGELIPYAKAGHQVSIDLHMSVFAKVTRTTFLLLQQLADPKAMPHVGFAKYDYLSGVVARATTSDPQLQQLASKLFQLQNNGSRNYEQLIHEITNHSPTEQRWDKLVSAIL
ncbi:MAG: hypothetical protein P0Y55_14145 [Candidatus Cohnella colombiensis]|uniref:Uncharacterized protein n=1 Tax=Candidatus Cohnella colombiensis TaxID=3121368 RepID=A0AA95JEY0_9BACL|nr:MAG: hypothetical protein P0Y55_14145 [Cohnella sp.]